MSWCNEYAPRCEGCRDIYRSRTPSEEPPCSECKPEVLPENREALDVYLLARNQVVTVGEGVADISFPAVKIVMDVLGVVDQRRCFLKVHGLFHEFRPKGK